MRNGRVIGAILSNLQPFEDAGECTSHSHTVAL